MNQALAKNVRRLARLELRAGRIITLTERATEAGNSALVAQLDKEAKRRAAEANYLSLRCEADLEDLDEAGQEEVAALRAAVLAGSRGSKAAKAIMKGALDANAGSEAAA